VLLPIVAEVLDSCRALWIWLPVALVPETVLLLSVQLFTVSVATPSAPTLAIPPPCVAAFM
jgi:hypothetical protein